MLYYQESNRLSKFEKKSNMNVFFLDSALQANLIVFNKTHGIEFDESSGSQNKYGNLDDVRGIQLNNVIETVEISDMRQREAIEDQEDEVILPSSVLKMTNLALVMFKINKNNQVIN